MEDFKEFDDNSGDVERRMTKSTNINKSGTARSDNLYTFKSPDLDNEETSNLSFCLSNLANFEDFVKSVEKDENNKIIIPQEVYDTMVETVTLLKEVIRETGDKIYSILDEENYITLIRMLEISEFTSITIKLLQSMFWSDNPPQKEIEILNYCTENTPLFDILMNLFRDNLCIPYIFTYMTNLIYTSLSFRNKFLETQETFDILMEHEDESLNRWKLNLLVALLNGPIMENMQERIILEKAVDLSFEINPVKFHHLLTPLECLTALKNSCSRDIIYENHLADTLTNILSCEKLGRRQKSLKILSNCCMNGKQMIAEMLRFNTHKIVAEILRDINNDNIRNEAAFFVSCWLKSCDDTEMAREMIMCIRDMNFIELLSSSCYPFKKNVVKIMRMMVSYSSRDENLELISPDILSKICEIADNGDDSFLEDVINMLGDFVSSISTLEVVTEVAENIRDSLDLEQLRINIGEENDELNDLLDNFVELIESHIPDD